MAASVTRLNAFAITRVNQNVGVELARTLRSTDFLLRGELPFAQAPPAQQPDVPGAAQPRESRTTD